MQNCRHDRYKDGHHMTGRKIERLTKSRGTNNIARTGPRITNCEDCGADLWDYDIHQIWTAEEIVRDELGMTIQPEKKRRLTTKERLRNQKSKLEKMGQERLL